MWFLRGMMSVINRCYAILMPCMNEMKLHSSSPSKSKKKGGAVAAKHILKRRQINPVCQTPHRKASVFFLFSLLFFLLFLFSVFSSNTHRHRAS